MWRCIDVLGGWQHVLYSFKRKTLEKVCDTSTTASPSLSLSLSFHNDRPKHYIQIGSGRCERGLHLLWEAYTQRRLIVGGGTENCAVMVENAERLIWVHFAAIISLSSSSSERWGRKRRKKKTHCSSAQPEMWHYVDNSVCGYCSDRHRHINASHYCL